MIPVGPNAGVASLRIRESQTGPERKNVRIRLISFLALGIALGCGGSADNTQGAQLSRAPAAASPDSAAASVAADSVLNPLYRSQFGMRYHLKRKSGWLITGGEFDNYIATPTLNHIMFEVVTQRTNLTSTGLRFLETPDLDTLQMGFVVEMLRWLGVEDARDASLLAKVRRSLSQNVSQIQEASPIPVGGLVIRAAHVGLDVIVHVDVPAKHLESSPP